MVRIRTARPVGPVAPTPFTSSAAAPPGAVALTPVVRVRVRLP